MSALHLIQEMAQWSSSLRYDDIPERVRAKARLQTLSVLAAVHSAAATGPGRTLLATAREWAGDGPCTLIPTGAKTSLAGAIFTATALSVAQDYDDYLLFGHTGHSAVLVPLLLGEKLGSSLQDALAAQVIANELEGRLGASVLLGPHNGQTWSFIHLLGSAAAAAKLLRLNAEQTAHALAISLYQPTYVLVPGFMGPDSKALTPASPSVTGVQAAILAGQGFTGALDLIENRQGFLRHFSYYPLPFMISGLGRAWTTDTLAYKIYPGCAYIDTTVDATLKLREDFRDKTGRDLDPEQVHGVKIAATALTVEMDALSKVGESFDVLNPVSVNFSIPGNVALCLLKGRLIGADLEREALQRDGEAIRRLAAKVVLHHDVALTGMMVASMNSALKLNQMMKEINLRGILRARGRIQRQYGRRMGLGWGEFKDLIRQAGPQLGRQIWKGIRRRAGAALAGEGGRPRYDLGDCNLEEFRMPFAARVTITLRDGTSLTRQQDIPLGGPGHALGETAQLIREKYRREGSRALPENQINALLDKADRLEELGKAADLVQLVVK